MKHIFFTNSIFKMQPLQGLMLFVLLATLGISSSESAVDSTLSYTLSQAELGKELYKKSCQLCHGTNLNNGQFGTPLRGSYFKKKWEGVSVAELLTFIQSNMPPEEGERLQAAEYADILAYILQRNKFIPGKTELNSEQLTQDDLTSKQILSFP
jgi:mono/diheme cytochrome c family protein